MQIRISIHIVIMMVIMLCLPGLTMAADAVTPLSLKDSIAMALEQNLVLRATREELIASAARRDEAITGFLPKFSTSYGYTRLNTDPWFPISGMEPLFPSTKMTAGTKDNFTWAVEVKQPIFAGGAIREGYRLSALGVDAASYEQKARMLDVVQQVRGAYYGVLKAQHLRDVARQSVTSLEAHRRTVQAFYDQEMVARNDVLYVEVELANSQKLLIQAESGVEMAKAQFNTILRRDMGTPVVLDDIPEMTYFGEPLESCLKTAEESRPEIKESRIKARQAERLVAIEKSAYYPSVGMVGHYEKFGDSPTLKGSDFKDKESWYVAGVAEWNFWEWGKTRDRVRAQKAYSNTAEIACAMLNDRVRLEVKEAYLKLQDARKQIEVAQKAVTQAEENFRINQANYREQIATNTDVLDAQTLLVRTRTDRINALADYHMSLAGLERTMGTLNIQ